MGFLTPFQVGHGLALGLTVIYSVLGLTFVYGDSDVVNGCHSGHDIVWRTTLWHYCLVSIIVAPAAMVLILLSPIQRVGEALRQATDRRENALRRTNPRAPKFETQSTVPDWLIMCLGSWLISVGFVLEVLSYWGYAELWLTKDLCKNLNVAFKETDLWTFGCVTFTLQLVIGVVLLIAGFCCWATPMVLELIFPSAPMLALDGGKLDGEKGGYDHGHYGAAENGTASPPRSPPKTPPLRSPPNTDAPPGRH